MVSYTAPELLNNASENDPHPSNDVYSFGILMWEVSHRQVSPLFNMILIKVTLYYGMFIIYTSQE